MLHLLFNVDKVSNTPQSAAGLRPLNARSLALSVLLGSHPPELPTRALVALAGLFGIASGTMRTALSRMVAADEVEADDGRYRLTGRLLDRQRAQDTGRRPPSTSWNGTWHTIIAASDQRDANERRRFRAVMANGRFGELRPDIWMRPANLDAPPTETGWIVSTGALQGLTHVEITRRLWTLDSIDADARRLLDTMRIRRTECDWDDPASIPALFTTSAEIVRFLRNEPLLPHEITPSEWPVDELRATYDTFEADHQRTLRRFLRDA